MRYKLYKLMASIAFIIAGLLQFTVDVVIESSITINVAKVVLLVTGVVCGFMYFDSRPKRTENIVEPKQGNSSIVCDILIWNRIDIRARLLSLRDYKVFKIAEGIK